MSSGRDLETAGVVDGGANAVDLFGPFRERRVGVELGEGLRHGLQPPGQRLDRGPPGLKGLALDGKGAVAGLADFGVQFGQFDGGEADLIGEGLAVDEGALARRPQQGLRRLGAGLEEIAEYGVVPDLEWNARLSHGARLEIGDHAAAVVAQTAGFLEFGTIAGGDEAAVAGQMRRLGHQTLGQINQQPAQIGRQREPVETGDDPRGRTGQGLAHRREQAGDALGDRQACADGCEIPWSAAAEHQSRHRAGDIGRGPQTVAQITSQVSAFEQPFDGVESMIDFGRVAQRSGDPLSQRPGTPEVTVRSIQASSDPSRSPRWVRSISRLNRVAGSMARKPVSPERRGGDRAGIFPAWVVSR